MKRPLDENDLLHVTRRQDWRAWLRKHFKTDKEIWLVFFKKHTGKTSILYNDAVEEALCFGWIDSTVRSVDDDRFAHRFSPRRPNSHYSQANRERLIALAAQGKAVKEVLATLDDLLAEQEFEIPPDILKAVRANKEAWRNLQALSRSYIRIRVAFIEGARKRPAEFEKRLRYFIKMTAKNKQFGYGGIEKYY